MTQMELRALEIMKGLRHSYLIQVQAYWESENQLMIAMELADTTLAERLIDCKRQKLKGIPAEELVQYFREAGEAVDFLHSQGVLHRDIKPENIMLLGGHVKVADLDWPRSLANERSVSRRLRSGLRSTWLPRFGTVELVSEAISTVWR